MKTKSFIPQVKTMDHVHIMAFTIICALLLVPLSAFGGAGKPDFSGVWKLNESKSTIGEGRFRLSPGLVVRHDGNNLEIERTRVGREGQEIKSTENLTLDGKEVVNEGENRSTKTTANWSEDGRNVVIASIMTISREGQTMEIKNRETWQLSDDGKTLTIQFNSSSPRGERNDNLVYDKSTE